MKITTFGTKNWHSAQLPRIEQGFINLGHKIIESGKTDLNYANDSGGYVNAIKNKEENGGKLILNVLDVPYLIKDFDSWVTKNILLLQKADVVTCISQTVKKNIKKYLNFDVQVIYNPIKNITRMNFCRFNPFLFVGRANDSGKRFNLVKEVSSKMNINVLVVGSENPNFGNYIGVVSDEELNYLYNVSGFLIYPAFFDGLGLPPIEMVCSGGFAVLCKDSETSVEFFPSEFLCEPNTYSIIQKVSDITSNLSKYLTINEMLAHDFSLKFHQNSIASNIVNVYLNL